MTPVDRETGSLLLALAKVGTFRLGGTLIGTNAFRLMEGDLGVILPLGGVANAGDVDIAQFERLSLAVQDQVEPSLAKTFSALKFEPVQSLDPDSVWRWKQGTTGTLVEFLTPSFEESEGIRSLPALGVNARALHYLSYLISDPIYSVALYREGVLVKIPRPEKFAIHKLIVADRRRDGPDVDKSQKDREQARFIIETMSEDRPYDLWEAYKDALSRGPKWRDRIGRSLERIPAIRNLLESCREA
ncbi:GSU2403 family nucleotidyltransferase fold protein [Marivita sp.]|uniref:nucleotidyltransferase family protein n=1 Tax=Marivita sp. TaxID=2003365 RepID=UPI003B51A8FF